MTDLVESQWETIQALSKTIETMRQILSKTQARLKELEAENIPKHLGGSTTESPKPLLLIKCLSIKIL